MSALSSAARQPQRRSNTVSKTKQGQGEFNHDAYRTHDLGVMFANISGNRNLVSKDGAYSSQRETNHLDTPVRWEMVHWNPTIHLGCEVTS